MASFFPPKKVSECSYTLSLASCLCCHPLLCCKTLQNVLSALAILDYHCKKCHNFCTKNINFKHNKISKKHLNLPHIDARNRNKDSATALANCCSLMSSCLFCFCQCWNVGLVEHLISLRYERLFLNQK